MPKKPLPEEKGRQLGRKTTPGRRYGVPKKKAHTNLSQKDSDNNQLSEKGVQKKKKEIRKERNLLRTVDKRIPITIPTHGSC